MKESKMYFAPDAIVYYILHIISLPLSIVLFIAFRRNEQHPTIPCYAFTLAVTSVVSCIVGFVQVGDMNAARGSPLCKGQGIALTYLLSSAAFWLLLTVFNSWLHFYHRRYNISRLRAWYMVIGWGLPVSTTCVAAVFALTNRVNGVEPWRYFCIAARPVIAPAILYFLLLVCMAGTLLLSVTNIVAMVQYLKGQREGINIVDRGLYVRVMVVGLLTSFVLLISSAKRIENVVFADDLKSKADWPDFLTVTPAYLAFLIFGTSDAARAYWAPRCLPLPFSDRSSGVLDQFSIVTPKYANNPSSVPDSERRSSMQALSTTYVHQGKVGSTSTSRLSIRSERSITGSFDFTKNPSFTINVDPTSSKNKGKGKQRAFITSIFGRANHTNINKVGVDEQRWQEGTSSNSLGLAPPSAARTRYTIAHGTDNAMMGNTSLGKKTTGMRQTVHVPERRFLKTFSFELRTSKYIIELPEGLLYGSDFDRGSTRSTDVESAIAVNTKQAESKPPTVISQRIARLSQMDLPPVSPTSRSIPVIKTPDADSPCRARYPIPPPLTIPAKPPATASRLTPESSRQQQPQQLAKSRPSFSFLARDPSVSSSENAASASTLPHTPSFGNSSDRHLARSTSSSRSMHSTYSSPDERDSPSADHAHQHSAQGLSLTPRESVPLCSMNLPPPPLPVDHDRGRRQ